MWYLGEEKSNVWTKVYACTAFYHNDRNINLADMMKIKP